MNIKKFPCFYYLNVIILFEIIINLVAMTTFSNTNNYFVYTLLMYFFSSFGCGAKLIDLDKKTRNINSLIIYFPIIFLFLFKFKIICLFCYIFNIKEQPGFTSSFLTLSNCWQIMIWAEGTFNGILINTVAFVLFILGEHISAYKLNIKRSKINLNAKICIVICYLILLIVSP